MNTEWCSDFLRRCLPGLGFRWRGFKRVKRQVCRRIKRRIEELGLSRPDEYLRYISGNASEQAMLDSMCRITISRFYRNRAVFDELARSILPTLASNMKQRGEKSLSAWLIGSCSGEEPYTLNLIWKTLIEPETGIPINITVTEADGSLIERATMGRYNRSSFRDMPENLIDMAFSVDGEELVLKKTFMEGVEFVLQDVREAQPDGPFGIVMCRNLAFTYFDGPLQEMVAERIVERLSPGGVLVIGTHEKLPESVSVLEKIGRASGIYRLQ